MLDNEIELLAPAGDWEAFVAAVENGADAVYLGGELFNARQFAGNFDNTTLKRALDYAHLRGTNVYLTMNTLLNENEIKQALEFLESAYISGIDAVIVQDLGLASVIKKVFPDIDLHASTQMTIYNKEGVHSLQKLGFKRAVLARELSIEEISNITNNTSLEIEIFVHGALCVGYSGQCLMSSIIGGRSGNRGKCAQPCRLGYELINKKTHENLSNSKADLANKKMNNKGYLLSPKDISSIEILRDIVDSGVKSLKIEGRMKSPEYVATVVRIYRKYLDEILSYDSNTKNKKVNIENEDLRDLTQIFNRGGFSRGYLNGKTGKSMMCFEKPKNWGIYLGEVLAYNNPAKTIKVKLEDDLSVGDGIEVWNNEDENPGNIVTKIENSNKNVSNAKKGDIVSLGFVSGAIYKDNKVYKTSDKSLITLARGTYQGKGKRKTKLNANINITKDKPILISIFDDIGNEVKASGTNNIEPAINRPTTKERVIEQISKTGATPFEFSSIEIDMDDDISVPISEINNVRRAALEELENKIVLSRQRDIKQLSLREKEEAFNFLNKKSSNQLIEANKLGISAFFYKFNENISYSKLNVERVVLPFISFIKGKNSEIIKKCKENGIEVFAWMPSITRGNTHEVIVDNMKAVADMGIDGVLVGNLGELDYCKNYKSLKVAGDYSLNIFNSFSINEVSNLGFDEITLSMELTLNQIKQIANKSDIKKEAIVYGRVPLMTSEYCAVGSIVGGSDKEKRCNNACEKGEYFLKDRKSVEFPIICDRIDCRSTILNANRFLLLDTIEKLEDCGISSMRLNFFDETHDEINEIIDMHRDVIKTGSDAVDNYKELIDKIKAKGFTKGHYFRGV